MKKVALTLALALVLGLGANAQSNELSDWNWDNVETYYNDANDLVMFDWSGFTDLFDLASGGSLLGNRDGGLDLLLPDHGLDTDVNAPLGSGIALLLGMGGAYLFAKRRKED